MRDTDRRIKRMLLRLAALGAALSLALLCGCRGKDGEATAAPTGQTEPAAQTEPTASPTQEASAPPEQTLPPLSFPAELEGGKLEVEGLFLYSGMNPDRGWAAGENIPVLMVKNCSGQYLTRAELTLTSVKGQSFTFLIEQVPDGQTVWAFAREEGSLESEADGAAVSGSTSFEPQPELPAGLECTAEQMTLTLQNHGKSALTGLRVLCHCLFEGAYFGGVVYEYPVEEIAPGSTAVVQAADCYLGEASVVRIFPEG